MEIDVFFVCEKILLKQLQVLHVPALDQWANALTKPLSSTRILSSTFQTQCGGFFSEKSSF